MTTKSPEPNPAADPKPEAGFDRRAFLWKVLDRYDLYIGTTVSRAATVTALNTLLVGYVILKAGDILTGFGGHSKLKWTAFVLLGVAGLAAFASTLFSFLAVTPYLGRSVPEKRSLIFFAHVAAKSKADFLKGASALSDDSATTDVAEQVHDVASGLSGKFKWLRHASWSTLVALVALLLFGMCVMLSTYLDWVK